MKLKADFNHFILIFLCGSLAFNALSQNSGQQAGKLQLRKLAETTDENLKDIAIYTEPLDQGFLRPKILVNKNAIEFFTPEGTVRNRVDFAHEFYTIFSANERYIAAIQTTKVPKDKGEKSAGEFQLFKDDGALLWQESYSVGWDVPGPIYRISSNGIVCKTTTAMGTISFHDQQGTKLAEHVLWPSFMRTGLEGKWSQDGRYYAVVSPHLRERIGKELRYADKLTLFNATGARLWEQILQDKSSLEVFTSSHSKWVVIRFKDMISKNFGATIFSTSVGQPVITLDKIFLTHTVFTRSDDLFIAISGSFQNPTLTVFESVSGKKVFEVNMDRPVCDVELSAEGNLIFVLLGERIAPQRAAPREQIRSGGTVNNQQKKKLEPTGLNKLWFTNIQLVVLSMNGTIIGSTGLPSIESVPEKLMIYSASITKKLFVNAGGKIIQYEVDF